MAEKLNDTTVTYINEWNNSLSGNYFWSNVNFGEAVTDIMTPLTWSVIQFTLDDWIFLPGIPTVGVIGGRPYLNISIFATLFYGLGRSREDLLDYLESTIYMHLPDDLEIPSISVSRKILLQGMFSSLLVQLKQRRGLYQLQSYLDSNITWFQNIRKEIHSQMTETGLYNLWHSEIKTHIKKGVWCVLGSVSYSADYTLKLRRQLEERVGPGDANVLIANLSDGDTPVDSLGPLAGLSKLANNEITRAVYLENYGHRGLHEFELSVPRPAEDPSWLDEELERMRKSPVDVVGLLSKQRQSFSAAWERLEMHSPKVAKRVCGRILESAHRMRLREMARSAYIRDRWAVRLFAIRAGELTGLGDQIFYLTLAELLDLLSGDRSVTGVIESRLDAYQQYKTLPPYPSVIRGRFDPFKWAVDPNRPTDIYYSHKTVTKKLDSDLLVGSPGSAGLVEGIVRIIDHPGNGDSLKPGEIMVAVQTDIAWTLLFPRVAAVITDIGAPLSHAAIVARELGIPAVVGCGNATTVLRTGDRVRVDGANGTVEILDH